MNLPNSITLFRIALIPVFVAVFSSNRGASSLWAAGIFLIASLTDLLDGYIARKTRTVTRLGKLLDPLADKLLIVSALILLVYYRDVAPWLAIVIIGRELLVSGLRAVAYTQGFIIAAEAHGKLKFVFQVAAVVLLLPDYGGRSGLRDAGLYVLYIAALLAVFSGVRYFMQFLKQFRESIE